ncbi:DUF3365 domain-containing protein [bacterium]|jgi:hypothetical protein|nr:DUF3365 domain-containing protein [bacterium]MBT4291308.1 DUF3365 domain-containing protein [bacterium]MBT7311808.1 DUF3365 domain-containing protein [bacterium]
MRFLILLLILLISSGAIADEINTYDESCKASIQKLGVALRLALKSAMEESGPVGALQTCNVEAVPITETISIEEGMIVSRTSLKTRNPKNAPDKWELAVLEQFEKGKISEFGEVVTDSEGHQTYRYMKAIPTAPLCLKCHGIDLDKDVSAKIAELYPEDKAVGFKTADIRGAFTIRKPLN